MGKSLLYAEVKPEGIFATENKRKAEYSYIPLFDISATVEKFPNDPNRYKSMNPKWLPWSQHQETAGQEYRVLLNAKTKMKQTKLVIFKISLF